MAEEQLELEVERSYIPNDVNPMVRAFGYGPEGLKCKSCTHLVCKQYANRYYKCDLRVNTNGPGTDHRVGWNACYKYDEGKDDGWES